MKLSTLALFVFVATVGFAQRIEVDGITFADSDSKPCLPVREVASLLNWPVGWDSKTETVLLKGQPVDMKRVVWMLDSTTAIPVEDLKHFGAAVGWDPATQTSTVHEAGIELVVRVRPKRAEVNIADQKLRAWQGDRLVMETNVSTGRSGYRTPTGEFSAVRKARMHYSSLYNNSPMPWSVQIRGHIFIHGYSSVPSYPASHGCIRVPLKGRNPAKWFWEWIDIGTPVSVVYRSADSN
ncbi:MAG: L,D-transpeptidase family protein [Fimbriimonadales bacterium]|nr:L,D-transpeptidase family protein [Fimbriimonadales bacterium]